MILWLQGDATTAAWCWKLTLTDSTVMGFTTHDRDLVIDGVTYEAATGFLPTTIDTSNTLAVDNLDVDGMLTSDRITADDLAIGRYDFAKVLIFLANWANLADSIYILRKGTLGQVSHGRFQFQAEIRGMMEPFQQQAGLVTQKTCRQTLGDTKCKVSLTSYSFTGAITGVNADGTFTTNLTQANNFFDYGLITFTSGDNDGKGYEIKEYLNTGGKVDTFLPTFLPVAIGDTFSIVAGCDGNLSTCKTRFNNVINFRAEPHVPGNDYSTSYPSSGDSNTVSEGQSAKRG